MKELVEGNNLAKSSAIVVRSTVTPCSAIQCHRCHGRPLALRKSSRMNVLFPVLFAPIKTLKARNSSEVPSSSRAEVNRTIDPRRVPHRPVHCAGGLPLRVPEQFRHLG